MIGQFRFYSRDAFVARQDIAIRIHHPLMMKRIIVMMIAMMMMALFKWTVEWVSFLHVPLLHRSETKACEDARIVLTRTRRNIITTIIIPIITTSFSTTVLRILKRTNAMVAPFTIDNIHNIDM